MRYVVSRGFISGAAALLAVVLLASTAHAQNRAEILRYVTGATVNTLDPNVPGSTRESFALSMSSYDRLLSFGRKQLNGKWVFDLDTITGELAESYSVSPDGLKLTFKLRADAKFHDGSPVTAEDVKWSLDRCVTAPVLGKAQLLTGSMTSADQFKVIDPLTAYQITSIMEGVVQRGTAAEAGFKEVGKPVAGKTGTTNDFKDAWFVGFTPDLAVGVYMGYDKPRHLGRGATGGHISAPIVKDFLKTAHPPPLVCPLRLVCWQRASSGASAISGIHARMKARS